MTEQERIELLIVNLEGGNGSQFAEKLGTTRATISRLRNGKRGIRLWIDKIIQAYPAVRREWLTTGEGYPGDLSVELVRANYEEKIRLNEKTISNLIKRIEQLEEMIEQNEG